MLSRAVLFDFDGVIADTENVHIAAWERTFALIGWDVPPEVCARAVEEDDRAFLASVFKEKGIENGDVPGWTARKQAFTIEMLASCPRVYPGLHDLIQSFEGMRTLAVVTGTWRENVATVLKACGLSDAFTMIIAKEDVERPKPEPDGYLLALKHLGIEAESAIVIEDSPTGLKAARTAGIQTIAVGHRRPDPEWAEDAVFVPNLMALRDHRVWLP